MTDPFLSSKRKLARAKEHIGDFKARFDAFTNEHPYEQVVELDPNNPYQKIHKIRLTKPIPECLDVIAADAVANLRAVLDQALYAVALASGHTISHAKFPFKGNPDDFERAVRGKSEYLPPDILSLLRKFKSYKGGNDFLCALNDWCNADKHALLTPAGTGAVRLLFSIHTTDGFFSAPDPHVWDRSNNEIVMFTTGVETKEPKYEFAFSLYVSFDQIEVIRGKPAVGVLNTFAGIVEGILMAIEAETMRLGYIP
jgi:hypothetical protein